MRSRNSYSTSFYDSVDERALRTGFRVFEILREVKSESTGRISDFGCGSGAFLRAARESGLFDQFVGYDLESSIHYVQKSMPWADLRVMDFCASNFIPDKSEWAICTEVLEHLPLSCALQLFDRVLGACNVAIFSAAQPGQGGTHHINEQPLTFWLEKARINGFQVFDVFRERLLDSDGVPRFYAHNLFLLVRQGSLPELANRGFEAIQDFASMKDSRTWWERVRYRVLSLFPSQVVTLLASLRPRG